jgi:hypothetical protein
MYKPDLLIGFPSQFLIWDGTGVLSPNWFLELPAQKSAPQPHLHTECIMNEEPNSIPILRYIAIDAHEPA